MRRSPLGERLLLQLLTRLKGEVQARKEVQHLRGVVKFTLLFASMVFVPALFLAYLALGSLQAEENQIDEELRTRADQAASQLQRDLRSVFLRFETVTSERLLRGQSPLTNLAELSPYVRAAFRFDAQGGLAAPFQIDKSPPTHEPTAAWTDLMARGRALESRTEWNDAASVYADAATIAADRSLAGEARLAQARSMLRAGRPTAAQAVLADVFADDPNVRDRRGFRLGDLASLQRAELLVERDPEAGTLSLQRLVEDLLTCRWTIGRPGEAAIARRALDRIDSSADPDWVGRARTRLDERVTQLYWADLLEEELELFAGLGARQPHGEFSYQSRVDTGSLWATIRWEDDLYAFSFHQGEILAALSDAAAAADALDNDLTVRLRPQQTEPTAGTLAHRALHPWVPLTVEVLPANPEDLRQRKTERRVFRIAILVILVTMTALGVGLTAMLVSRELEGARMKTDFAANVSHELRSPITQIRLKAEALQLDLVVDDDDRRSHYEAIVRESERLSRLVDNVLDFSAIERGSKSYTFRPLDLGELVWNTVESSRSTLEARGLVIHLDLPDDLPVVWADREAIAQVVINLLSNAAKYGADGGWVGVCVRLGLEGLDVSISDRGLGISKDELPHIFDHFFRSEDPAVRRRKGTGIGLSIVRYIVEAHRGTISVDSEPGQGTTFTVSLPLEAPDEAGG